MANAILNVDLNATENGNTLTMLAAFLTQRNQQFRETSSETTRSPNFKIVALSSKGKMAKLRRCQANNLELSYIMSHVTGGRATS